MGLKEFYRGKSVVITGASSGIGADLAEYLAGFGAKLCITARREEKLKEVKERCEALGAEVLVMPADVTDTHRMAEIRDAVVERFGQADIIIANAGVGGLNPAEHFDMEIHRKTVEINVMGLANTLVPFIPGMVERKSGILVGVSSLAGFRGLPNAASYSSTKSQQMVFMESLRVDLKKHNVAAMSIHPGFVKTPMTAHDDFDMPFMVPVRKSSHLIAKAIMKRKARYLYPWPMKILTWFNRHLPCWLYDWFLPKVSGQKDPRPKML